MIDYDMAAPPPLCPLVAVPTVTACNPAELTPLVRHLRRATSPPEEPIAFRRGTLLPDGRLDLCKQSIGTAGLERVLDAMGDNHCVAHLLLGLNGLGDDGIKLLSDRYSAQKVKRTGFLGHRAVPIPAPLKTLYLGCNMVTERGVLSLCELVDSNSEFAESLSALWLKRNPIGSGYQSIAKLLMNAPALRVLDLDNTMIEDVGAAHIIETIAEGHCLLEHLYLSANGAGHKTGRALGRLIAQTRSLKSLYVGANALEDQGFRAMLEGLAKNRTLETLIVASNGLGDTALIDLEALSLHPKLRYLDIGNAPNADHVGAERNIYGDAGADKIAAYIAKSPSALYRLDMRNAGLNSRHAKQIEQAIGENSILQSVSFGKYVARSVKRRINHRLAENRQTSSKIPPHIAAIQSVYR